MYNDPPIRVSASDRPAHHRWGRKRLLSASVIVAFVFGVVFVVIFNMTLDWTNTEKFCISCHEMQHNYEEYRNSAHNLGRTGVRATCADCHVPKEFFPKILRKIGASNDLLHWMLGSIDTPEKFEEKRAVLAQRVWKRLKASDSQECRNCHVAEAFDLGVQGRRASARHEEGLLTNGQTCIDCHKGIAHHMPKGLDLADLSQQADGDRKAADSPAAEESSPTDPPKTGAE